MRNFFGRAGELRLWVQMQSRIKNLAALPAADPSFRHPELIGNDLEQGLTGRAAGFLTHGWQNCRARTSSLEGSGHQYPAILGITHFKSRIRAVSHFQLIRLALQNPGQHQ